MFLHWFILYIYFKKMVSFQGRIEIYEKYAEDTSGFKTNNKITALELSQEVLKKLWWTKQQVFVKTTQISWSLKENQCFCSTLERWNPAAAPPAARQQQQINSCTRNIFYRKQKGWSQSNVPPPQTFCCTFHPHRHFTGFVFPAFVSR